MRLLKILLLVLAPALAFGQGAPLPDVQQQQFGATGVPDHAGFVCTYAAGTSTPLATYSDVTLTTSAHNPIQLNQSGRPVAWGTSTEIEVYAQARSYKVVVHAAGTGSTCNGTTVGAAISTRDNISAANIYTATFASLMDDKVCHASQAAGANAGAKITACHTALPSTGGTIDTSGLEGTQTATATITLSKPVKLLLCGITLTTTATTGFTVSANGVTIEGCAERVTTIGFNPSATSTLISWTSGGSGTITHGSIKNLTLDAVSNTANVKTAIKVVDAEELEISHVYISNWSDSTHASTGIELSGRQTFDIHDITDFSDLPFHIKLDPNTNVVEFDHAHFYNIYASAHSTQPVWKVDDGVFLTNNTWDGYQAWVGGTYGFYYSSASETTTGYNNSISNCRYEQSANAGGASIYFAPGNAATYNTTIRNCTLSASVNQIGIYLRNLSGVKVIDNTYALTGVALNINSTVSAYVCGNFFNRNNGATLTTTGSIILSCFNDATGSNVELARIGIGVASPANPLALANATCVAGQNAAADAEICIGSVNASNNVAIGAANTHTVVSGSSGTGGLYVGTGIGSSKVNIPNNTCYGAVNNAGAASICIASLSAADKPTFDSTAAGAIFGAGITASGTVDATAYKVGGVSGVDATLTCGGGQAVKTITVNKGLVTAVTCGAP